jgi:hypothetical protein
MAVKIELFVCGLLGMVLLLIISFGMLKLTMSGLKFGDL